MCVCVCGGGGPLLTPTGVILTPQFLQCRLLNLRCNVNGHTNNKHFKVAATSLKLDIKSTRSTGRHEHTILYRSNFLRSPDWLMRSALGYFARNLISGVNDGAASLNTPIHT